jgi:hypothetical protein
LKRILPLLEFPRAENLKKCCDDKFKRDVIRREDFPAASDELKQSVIEKEAAPFQDAHELKLRSEPRKEESSELKQPPPNERIKKNTSSFRKKYYHRNPPPSPHAYIPNPPFQKNTPLLLTRHPLVARSCMNLHESIENKG